MFACFFGSSWLLSWEIKICCNRSSHSEVFLRKCVLKICSKFTGEHPWWSAISTKLQSNFFEIELRYAPVNLLHILRAPFQQNTSEWLLLLWEKTQLAHPSAHVSCSFKNCNTFSYESIRICDIEREARNIIPKKSMTYKNNPWKAW